MKNLLITGKPGVGKTTLICQLAAKLPEKNICGFFTEEIREHGQRVGFSIATFDGLERTLSHTRFHTPFRVGRYCVDVQALNDVVDHLRQLPPTSSGITLIDEIGKMESFSENFRRWIETLLEGPYQILATISLGGNPWIQSIKRRRDVQIFELTLQNRDSLSQQLLLKILEEK